MSLPYSISKSLFHQMTLIAIAGLIVAIPFVMILYMLPADKGFDNFLWFYAHHAGFVYFVLIILIFLVGLMLENIGSVFEWWLDEQYGVSKKAWNSFLFSRCGDDELQIIHKYVDSVVFRYKI